MLDTFLGGLVISLPFVLSAIFIFIPSQSENRRVNTRWRVALVVSMALYGLLAWYQQKRVADLQDRAARDAHKVQSDLQRRLDSMDVSIGELHVVSARNTPVLPPSPSASGLQLEILGANISVPENPPGSSQLALDIAVHNTSGSGSVAADYELEVTTPDHVKHDAIFIRLGDKGELRWTSKSGVVTVIPASDAIEDKTENKEIIAQGIVRGRALFILPGVPQDQVIDPRTELSISAQGSSGKRFVDKETILSISKK